MATVFAQGQELLFHVALAPVGAHQYPETGRDPPTFFFPGQYMLLGQQEIVVAGHFMHDVDDTGRRDEFFRSDGVGRVLRKILACDPVNRGIEIGAGVLAAGKIIPVSAWTTAIVLGHFFHAEWPGLAQFRRQGQSRRADRQRLCQVDHANRSRRKRSGKIHQLLCAQFLLQKYETSQQTD